jgi:MFS family permease
MRAGWALLRRRDFGLLWTGGLISETGDWLLLVGLPVWVLQVTGSSLVTATVFLVGLLPSLVMGPVAGVLVDRWDRRRTLVAVSLAEAACLLPLLAVDGRGDLWIVYLVMAVEAALGQLNDPARNALVPALVGRGELVGANGLIGLNGNLARLAGGVLVVGLAARLEPGRLLGVSLLAFGAISLALWNGPVLTTGLALYLALFVAAGIPGIGILTGLTALVQARTEDAYLGRVFATYLGTYNGLQAVGMLLAGLLGDVVGVVAVLNGEAVVYLVAGVTAWLALARPSPSWCYPRTSKRARMPLA